MKLVLRWVLPIFFLLNAMPGRAQSLDQMKDLWRNKKWEQVIPMLSAYRNQPGGRTWQVDYMLGTSECHVSGKEKKGEAVLNYVLENYHLPDNARDAATKAIDYCQHRGSAAQQEPPFLYVPIAGQMTNGPLVAGKGGYMVSSGSALTTVKLERSPVAITELQKRVYSLKEPEQALKAATARIPGSRGAVKDGFVVVCTGYCDFSPERVGECLESYRSPLLSEFDMAIPQSLVTVYVASDTRKVGEYASQLHGISLPLGTVAYSVYEDLSIVGIASESACGSLAHELVHLSIREKFGDSPPWLEEGLASEVAVSYPAGRQLKFGASWRDDTLKKEWPFRPTVEKLLAANWNAYSANDRASVAPVASLHAMAAAFIRYLDARKKLEPVYFAMRDKRFPEGADAPRSDTSILQEQLGMNLAQIDADFVKWFGYTEPRSQSPGNNPPEVMNKKSEPPTPEIKK